MRVKKQENRAMSDRILPVTLTVAGSDSGGGAGIQADLRTFGALGTFGTSVITCVTAQNPTAVPWIEPCSSRMVLAQLEAVLSELPPGAVKIGMLHTAAIVRTVTEFLKTAAVPSLIIDPLMVSTSGRSLLERNARRALEKLLPLASLITPNLDEVESLLGCRVRSVEAMRGAAGLLARRFGCAVLVKGGHLRGVHEAVDFLRRGDEEYLLTAPFVRRVATHGTGCTYSAAIAAFLARGETLAEAVRRAKEFVSEAIACHRLAARHPVLGGGFVPPGPATPGEPKRGPG